MKSLQAFFVFLLVFLLAPSINAQETGKSLQPAQGSQEIQLPPDLPVPPKRDTQGFLGQDHTYSVVFRGNGEAVVSLRVVLTNKGENPLSEVTLKVPKVQPSTIAVYQVIRDKICVRYNQPIVEPLTRMYPTGPQTCAEYQEPDYSTYYYGASKYQKADAKYTGNTVTVTLPFAIESGKSGSYFVYYRTLGYADKNIFGGYNYNFESLQVDDDIRNLQVGINTDSDLLLKGAKGDIQYRFNESTTASLGNISANVPVANSAIDTFYNQIGQGRIVKTASSLAPFESYIVSGTYAKNTFALYAKEIAIGSGTFLVFVIISILAGRFIRRSLVKPEQISKKEMGTGRPRTMLFVSVGVGFITALLMIGFTGILLFVFELLSNSYYVTMPIMLFLGIISFCIYTLLLFLPGVIVGFKRGLEWGIATVIATVVWMVLLGGVIVFIIFIFAGQSNQAVYPL